MWRQLFRPNSIVTSSVYTALMVGQIVVGLLLWTLLPSIIPSPLVVWRELVNLVMHGGLLGELWVSLVLNVEAIVLSTVLALIISYASAIPFFKPITNAIGKGRFISLVGIGFIITVLLGGGHMLKLTMLTFGMTVFFVTSMIDVVDQVPSSDLDYARTLRMTEWEVWWEMRVLATIGSAMDILRQNAAMGWLMLVMVEGVSRSEGGIGKMLLDQEKHFSLAAIIAIQSVFLMVGVAQDVIFRWIKPMVAPHAELSQAKK